MPFSTSPRTAIVADDVPEILDSVVPILEAAGYVVRRAETGVQLIKLFREQPCDLLVTDILMPEADGIEVINAMKTARPVPRILAMTGGGGPLKPDYLSKMAKTFGANVVLCKPFTRDQFLAAVNEAFAPTAA